MSDEPREALDLGSLHDEIQNHPGTRARRSWDALLDVHALLEANQGELLGCVKSIERNEGNVGVAMAGTSGAEDDKREMFREVIRLLHNYVASAGTLVDHTRNLTSKYKGTATYDEYKTRLQDAISNEVVIFVSKLRNYVLHVGVPAIGVNVAVNEGVASITVYLDRDEALKWKDWPKAARSYLNSKSPHISLVEVIEEYAGVIDSLYRWLYDQFPTWHDADMTELKKLIHAFRTAYFSIDS